MSITDPEYLQQLQKDILFLEKLLEEVDPASCMSISLRRGVPQDNPDREGDETERPWRIMSFTGGDSGRVEGMQRLIQIILVDRRDALRRAVRWTEQTIVDQKKAVEEANKFLESRR